MIEDDLAALDRMASRRSLAGLEAGIWQAVNARREAQRTSRALLACQAAVAAIALFSSVAAGSHMAAAYMAPRPIPNVLSVASDLSPSARLIGY